MAHTLDVFRKNQKFIMAVLCVVLIFGWLIGDAVMKIFGFYGGGPGRGQGGEAFATWKYGTITNVDMQQMRQRDLRLREFLYQECPRQMDPRLGIAIRNSPDDQLLAQLVMAKKGDLLGLQVSDEQILSYVRRESARAYLMSAGRSFTADMVENLLRSPEVVQKVSPTGTQFRDALKKAGMTQSQLFSMVRNRVLADEVERLFVFGIGASAISPADRFEEYRKMAQQYTIEAVALPVKDYFNRIDEKGMTEAALKQLYEAHKNDFAADGQIGFRQPLKIAFQFYKADLATFLPAAELEIKEAEIEKYYKEHKDDYIKKDDDKTPPDDLPAADFMPPADLPAAESPKADAPKADAPKADAPKAEVTKPAAPKVDAPKTDPPKTAPPKADPPKTNPAKPGTKSGTMSGGAPTQWVMFQAGDATPKSGDKPAAPVTPPKDLPTGDGPATNPPTDLPAGDPPTDPKSLVNYLPLEAVKGKIRKKLAEPIAQKKAREVLQSVEGYVRDYERARSDWRLNKATKPDLPAPPVPTFGDLGKPHGLQIGQCPLVSIQQFVNLPEVGGLFFFDPSAFQQVLYANFAYSSNSNLTEYSPRIVNQGSGSLFLIWKIEEKAGYIPTFDQARKEVEEAWKTEAASNLAKQEAQRLADLAKKNPTFPLRESLAKEQGYVVIEVGPFSWKVRSSGDSYKLGKIDGINDAGVDFMKSIYELGLGEVGLAWNQPKSIVYTVRVSKLAKSLDQLVSGFMEEATAYDFADYSDRNTIVLKWYKSLEEEMELKREEKVPASSQSGEPVEY